MSLSAISPTSLCFHVSISYLVLSLALSLPFSFHLSLCLLFSLTFLHFSPSPSYISLPLLPLSFPLYMPLPLLDLASGMSCRWGSDTVLVSTPSSRHWRPISTVENSSLYLPDFFSWLASGALGLWMVAPNKNSLLLLLLLHVSLSLFPLILT